MALGLNDHLMPLSEAARLVPGRRLGRPTAPSTLFRWAQSGLGGVRLEVLQVGGTKCTSPEALERFFSQLTARSLSGEGGNV